MKLLVISILYVLTLILLEELCEIWYLRGTCGYIEVKLYLLFKLIVKVRIQFNNIDRYMIILYSNKTIQNNHTIVMSINDQNKLKNDF